MEQKTKSTENYCSFNNLPNEIILNILPNLNLNDLLRISRTSKQLLNLARSNFLWQQKLNQHFPNIHNELKSDKRPYFFNIFARTYHDEYKIFSPANRKLTTWIKELEFVELTKNIMNLKECLKQNFEVGKLWIEWLNIKKVQSMSNYLYQTIQQDYLNKNEEINIFKEDDNFNNLLHWAILLNQDIGTIDRLVKAGISPYQFTGSGLIWPPFYWAAYYNRSKIVDFLLEELDQDRQAIIINETNALWGAANGGHIDLIKLFLNRKANIHNLTVYEEPLLHGAVRNSHKDVIKLLLNHGADINQAAVNGDTPLFVAANHGHQKIVKLLLKQGANINQAMINNEGTKEYIKRLYQEKRSLAFTKNNNSTVKSINHISPLFIAIFNNYSHIVKLLLEHGALDDQVIIDDKLPIHIAIEEQECEIIKMLLFAKENKFESSLYDELNATLTEPAVLLTARASLLIKLHTYINRVKSTKASFSLMNFFASPSQNNVYSLRAASALWKFILSNDISELNQLEANEKKELEKGELGIIYQQLIRCGLLDKSSTDANKSQSFLP